MRQFKIFWSNDHGGKTMKKVFLFALSLVLTFLSIISLTACGKQSPTEEETNFVQVVDNRSDAEKWRDTAIDDFKNELPYVSIVAFDDETRAELDAIPEKFVIYKDNFNVEFENPSDFTEMLVTAALSDSKYDRHVVAGRADCPIELLVKIAKDEPDSVVRFRASGNLLSRDDLSEEFLIELANSEYADARLTAIMHKNCSPNVVSMLVNDADSQVKEEANKKLSSVS